MKKIDCFVRLCIQKEYVSQDEAQWLRYALEKRIVSMIAFIPVLIVGLLITNPASLFGFLVTFFLLRIRTNGFHAKSVGRCLLYSVFGEVFFLKVLPMVWNDIVAFIALAMSIILIWVLAPYNHPNMELSSEEVTACANSAKWRLGMLVLSLSILYIWQQDNLAEGILFGIIMTASTLATAYCLQKTEVEEKI